MHASDILAPMTALAIWTMTVLLLIPIRRFAAARRKQVTVEDFRFGESANVPPEVAVANRNYMNLLELPVLFYTVCLALHVTGLGNGKTCLLLAWAYVALRILHSVIHLSYNNVMHRLMAFASSNFVLLAIWVLFISDVYFVPAG